MTLRELFDVRGRAGIITGGAGLLGTAFAEALAEAGVRLVLADARGAVADRVADRLRATWGGPALAVEVDITDPGSVRQMVERTVAEYEGIDILINNAAFTAKTGSHAHVDYFAPVERYPVETWGHAVGVNLTGAFLCSQAAGAEMVRRGGGVIINIASTYGVVGPDQRIYEGISNPYDPSQPLNTPAVYSVTKAGILGLTRYLATYWAKANVRVNALTPGGVYESHTEEFVKAYTYRTPLGRMANVDDYKGAILFLASDASRYMTGANLVVDGGWTAW